MYSLNTVRYFAIALAIQSTISRPKDGQKWSKKVSFKNLFVSLLFTLKIYHVIISVSRNIPAHVYFVLC